jgi:uncharacterized protein (DUF1697 family)
VTRQIALLRGINVGGARRLAMADLRATMAALGYADATTLLQSGNVVYSSHDPPATAEKRIRERLAADAGMDIPVIVRTAAEMRAVVKRNPLRGQATIPKWHHVVFLSELPDRTLAAALDGAEFEPDMLALHGREAFVWWPQGAHNARLTSALLERRLGVAATARNWNTVEKLRALSEDG